MQEGRVNTDWVDESFASVALREDIDGMKQVVLSPDRQIHDLEDYQPSTEIIMDVRQARKLARMLNRAARRASVA